MGLRVDREAALAWLGIEGYRPSGRLRRRPPGRPDVVPTDEPVAADSDRAAELVESAGLASPEPARPPLSEPPAEPTSREQAPADGLFVRVDSPHRPLAEAIGRVAGLGLTTGDGGDCMWIDGERWDLASVARDGTAKRRLWRALVGRGRRPRA